VGGFKVFILWGSSWTFAFPLGICARETGRQQRVQELGLGGGVGCRLEGTWGDERARDETTKRVAREPSESVVRVTG
jgi:hypothetical protein